MKLILKFLLPAICILIYCTGCKKDSDSSSSSYLRGKVDGVAFECNSDIRATAGGAGDKIIFFGVIGHRIQFASFSTDRVQISLRVLTIFKQA